MAALEHHKSAADCPDRALSRHSMMTKLQYYAASAPLEDCGGRFLAAKASRMGATNYQMALAKRYSKLTGQLNDIQATIVRIKREHASLLDLEGKIENLEILISSLANLMEAEDSNWEPAQTPAIKPWKYQIPVPFGSTSRRGMEVLRNAVRPMTAREIALEVLCQAGVPSPAQGIILRTTNTITSSLRKFRGRTVESSGKYPAQWRVIHNPNIAFDI